MSRREETAQLAGVMEAEVAALQALERAMRAHRMAFVALRPSEIEAGVAPLDAAALACRELAERRTTLQARLGARLDEITAGQPAALQRRVRAAAGALRAAASAVRIENGVGARLLEFSRRAQENMLMSLYAHTTTSGYDRRAKAVHHGAPRGSFVTGTL